MLALQKDAAYFSSILIQVAERLTAVEVRLSAAAPLALCPSSNPPPVTAAAGETRPLPSLQADDPQPQTAAAPQPQVEANPPPNPTPLMKTTGPHAASPLTN